MPKKGKEREEKQMTQSRVLVNMLIRPSDGIYQPRGKKDVLCGILLPGYTQSVLGSQSKQMRNFSLVGYGPSDNVRSAI